MNTSPGESYKFTMSSISISSSSSSTITTFCDGLSLSLKAWYSLKTKLEKYKKLNICQPSLLDFIASLLLLSKNL